MGQPKPGADFIVCHIFSGQWNKISNFLIAGCKRHPLSPCPLGYIRFKNKCYKVIDEPKTFSQAQTFCQNVANGHLVEIKNQLENNFLSDFIVKTYPYYQGESFWTGGVSPTIAGLQLNLWHASKEPIIFDNFYNKNPHFQPSNGIALYFHDDYYFWKYQDLYMALPFVCQAPLKDIGCLEDPLDQSNQYEGTASITEFGDECIPWNTPALQGFLYPNQSIWDHNYCRKISQNKGPSCFYFDSEGQLTEDEICSIPLCSSPELHSDIGKLCSEAFPERFPERTTGVNDVKCSEFTERSDIFQLCSESFPDRFPEIESTRTCPEPYFQCKNKKCIEYDYLCDGESQCGDFSDEDQTKCNSPIKVRLKNGPRPTVGRVEIRHNGIWGTICEDKFGEEEAKVLCKMAGFPSDNAKIYNLTTNFKGSGPIWISLSQEDTCTGDESDITQCNANKLWNHDHHCNHQEDVAISCEIENNYDSDLQFRSTEIDVDDRTDIIDIQDNEAIHSAGGPSIDCGLMGSKSNLPRIQGGVDVTCGEHPWQAGIRVKGKKKDYHWCGASIISHFHLITAAHCLRDFSKSSYLIRVGDCHLDVKEREETDFDIEEIIFHETFNEGPYLNNDIAIIKIKTLNRGGMDFGRHVQPVCLPSPNLAYPPNLNLTITGWGKLGFDSENPGNLPRQNKQGAVIILQKADVPILTTSTCTSPKVHNLF